MFVLKPPKNIYIYIYENDNTREIVSNMVIRSVGRVQFDGKV